MKYKFTLLILFLSYTVVDSVLADGKLLIFSTPQERVVNETKEPKRPIYLVDSGAPEYVQRQLHNRSYDSIAEVGPYALPVNLRNRVQFNEKDFESYLFPVPDPVSNLSDFGVLNRYVFYRSSLTYQEYAQSVELENKGNADSEQSGESKQPVTAPSFPESLWNETYHGEVNCANPALAHGLKVEFGKLIKDAPKESVIKDGRFVSSDSYSNEGVFFNNDETRVIIAWNGKENSEGRETMIVTSGASSLFRNKRAAALSIIPLPGKPIAITRANPRAFYSAMSLLNEKNTKPNDTIVEPSTLRLSITRIGAHNIFVWKLENLEDFCDQVIRYVSCKYNGRAFPLLGSETLRVLEYYFKCGFHYFAFDLTEVGLDSEKETIAYTFKSKRLYFPLVVNRIGGSDDYSNFDLILITPNTLQPNPDSAIKRFLPPNEAAIDASEATLVHGVSCAFTLDEIRRIDKTLDVFDAGVDKLIVSNIHFNKQYNSFVNDFIFSVSKDDKSVANKVPNSSDKTQGSNKTVVRAEPIASDDLQASGSQNANETVKEKQEAIDPGQQLNSQTPKEPPQTPVNTTPTSSETAPNSASSTPEPPENAPVSPTSANDSGLTKSRAFIE